MLGAVLAAAPVSAQTQPPTEPDPPARFHADVVVTPERGESRPIDIPGAVAVVDAATLRTQPAVSLGEALSFVAGLQVQRAAFHARLPVVSARGFFGGGEADYVLLLIDGIPALDAESGLADWSAVSLASIRRIETSRGPGASSYGDSAVGGVVQVLTNRTDPGGQVSATGGTFRTLTVDGADRQQFDRAAVRASGLMRRTSGSSDHSDARYVAATAGIDGRVGQAQWHLTGSGHHRALEDPGALPLAVALEQPGASDPLARFDRVGRHGYATALDFQQPAGTWSHQERLYVNSRQEEATRTILLAPGFGDRQARTLSTTILGGSALVERRMGSLAHAGLFRAGIDLSRERLDTSYVPVSDDGVAGTTAGERAGHRRRAGVFVTSGWNPLPRARVSGGVRWDHVDDQAFGTAARVTSQAWSPRLGVSVALSEALPISLFTQVSTAFKVPTLDQLFDPRPYPDASGGAFTISNRDLVPQRAMNVEAGIHGRRGLVQWSALAYRLNVHDEIDFDARTFSYGNIGNSRHSGAELELSGRLWRRVQPSMRYVLTRVSAEGAEQQLKNVPRHAVMLTARLDLPLSLTATVNYRRSSGAFLDDANAIGIEGPSAWDLRARRAFGRREVFLDVINLTNDRYVEYGFTLAEQRAGSGVPYAYPGAPRAIRGGITLGF
jgi:outer membrane receptor protein involved in Fe transport